jgi:uncharacterized protein (DUF58 family)
MWLYTIAFPLAALIVVGSVLMGGVYTIVAIPIVLLALAGGILWRAIGRATVGRRAAPPAGQDAGHRPATPGELADARRAQQ